MNTSITLYEPGNIALILFSFLLILWIYKTFFTSAKKAKTLPPGPTGLLALKMLLAGISKERLLEVAETWAKRYGDIVLCQTWIGNICFLNSARATREVYKGKDTEFVTNERPKSFVGSFVFYNYQNMELSGPSNKHWPSLRKLFHSGLKFYGEGVERFESTVQTELERLKERVDPSNKTSEPIAIVFGSYIQELEDGSKEVDMHQLIVYSVASVLAVLMTGECPEPTDPVVTMIKEYARNIDKLFNPANDQVLTIFPFLRFAPGSRFKQMCDDIIRARDGLLQALLLKRESTRIRGQPRGIADFFKDEQSKKGNEWLKDEHVFGLILDIIGAGTDTSLNSLLSIVLLLVHHPHIMKNIQKEIDEMIGQRKPCLKDMKVLIYTEAVILETIRYTSIVPLGIVHQSTADIFVDGFCIPSKSLIYSNTWCFQRDPMIWGDPEVFRPERFLDSDGQILPPTHPLQQSLLPFGVGKRACPGEKFARSRIFLYVVNILQKFNILPPVKHKLPPLTRHCWKPGVAFQVLKYHVIFKQRPDI